MVRYTLRIPAFGEAVDFLRHDKLLLLDHLEVADDVDRGLRGYEGELVEFLVLEELVLYLDDALLAEELACKVYTYCYLIPDALQVEDIEGLEYIFSGYMVQNGTILQCAYYQFFS